MTPTSSAGRREFVIQRGRVTDIEAILTLAEASPAAAQWSRAEYVTACVPLDRDEGHAKALFVAYAPGAFQPESRAVLGFAAFSALPFAGEYELANMAVAADSQRQGVGSRLLAAGILWCRSCGPAVSTAIPGHTGAAGAQHVSSHRTLWLEVRASNDKAVAFYQHAGFAAVEVRASYYARPVEDAIAMRRPLRDRA